MSETPDNPVSAEALACAQAEFENELAIQDNEPFALPVGCHIQSLLDSTHALLSEELAQREEELAAERRKNAHLVTRFGETREALIDAVALIERIHKTLS